MPYIKKENRKLYDNLVDELSKIVSKTNIDNCTLFCGDLNYIITTLIHKTLKESNLKESYGLYNEMIGMLECAKLELYRRKVSEYEDIKIEENGDV